CPPGPRRLPEPRACSTCLAPAPGRPSRPFSAPVVRTKFSSMAAGAARMTPTSIRITHVIVGLDVGGAERFLHRLVQAHHDSPLYQHRVISLTSKGVLGPRLEAEGFAVSALGMTSISDAPRTYSCLKREPQAQRLDILQCWMYYAGLLGGLAGRRLGIKHILWGIRNSHFESGGTRLKRM